MLVACADLDRLNRTEPTNRPNASGELGTLVSAHFKITHLIFQMNEKIAYLEKELLEKKPWQLQGEVTAQKRPENSLLEETLHFDHAVRMGMVPGRFSIMSVFSLLFVLKICNHTEK